MWLESKTLLTHDESSFIKGILIFFVVMGHNVILTNCIPDLWTFLNSFNVAGFFLVTFLYGYTKTTFPIFLKKTARNILPAYVLAFFTYVLFYAFFTKGNVDYSAKLFLESFFLGGTKIKDISGFLLLWFFPAFLYFSIFKFFAIGNRYSWVFLASIVLAIYLLATQNYFCYLSVNALLSGLYFISFGKIFEIIIRKFNGKILLFFTSLIMLSFIFALYLGYKNVFPIFVVPISVMVILFNVSKNPKFVQSRIGAFFIFCGKKSMFIYVIHSLVFYALYLFVFRDLNLPNLFSGTLTFILTFILTLFFASFLQMSIKYFRYRFAKN